MTSLFKSLHQLIFHKHTTPPITVVSGLPRSGTSMLMQMLHQGGMSIMTDDIRQSDESNPKGYYEYEAIKNLAHDTDTSWLQAAEGKAIKVISHILKSLPNEHNYRVILIERDLKAVLQSQNTMLKQRNQPNVLADEKALNLYRQHQINLHFFLAQKSNFEVLRIGYDDTLINPKATAHRINKYLGNHLDEGKMIQAVVPKLCHQ